MDVGSPSLPTAVATRAQRAAFPVAALAVALAVLAGTLPTPLYGDYQDRLGWSTLVVTLVYAAYVAGTAVALIGFGRLSDGLGRRPVMAGAIVVGAASSVLFLVADALGPVLIARVLSGASVAMIGSTSVAYLAELDPRGDRARGARINGAVQMLGLGVGPVVAGVLASTVGDPLRVPYAVDLGILALAALLVALLPETVERSQHATLRPQRIDVPGDARPVFLRVLPGIVGAFAVQGFFAALSSSFLRAELHISEPATIGVVAFAVFAGSAAGGLAAPRFGERAFELGTLGLPVGLVIAAAAVLSDALALVVLSAVTGGFAVGVAFGGALSLLNAASPPERRGEVNAALLMAVYVGISIPALGVGFLTEAVVFRTAVLIFLGVVAVLALTSAVLVRRAR